MNKQSLHDLNPVGMTSISHPEVPILGLDAPSGTKITHRKPRKMKKPSPLDGLREYSHLSGGIARRKEQLKKMRKPHQPSGSKHYMARRARRRYLEANGPRADKVLYYAWRKGYKRSHGVLPEVSFEEWWYVVRGTVYETGTSKLIRLRPYDESDHSIHNMYVSYLEWGLSHGKPVFLADASLVLAERTLSELT